MESDLFFPMTGRAAFGFGVSQHTAAGNGWGLHKACGSGVSASGVMLVWVSHPLWGQPAYPCSQKDVVSTWFNKCILGPWDTGVRRGP